MSGGFLRPSLSLSTLTLRLSAGDYTPMMTCLTLTLFPHPHCQNSKLHYFLGALLQDPPLTISFKSLVLVLPRQSNCLILEQFRVQSINHVSTYISSLVISASHLNISLLERGCDLGPHIHSSWQDISISLATPNKTHLSSK